MKVNYIQYKPNTVELDKLEYSVPFKPVNYVGIFAKVKGGLIPKRPYDGAIPCFCLEHQDLVFFGPATKVIPLLSTITVQEVK